MLCVECVLCVELASVECVCYVYVPVQMYGAEFIETSAKTGFNVANCLLMLVR